MLIRIFVLSFILFYGVAVAAPLTVETRTMKWDLSKHRDEESPPYTSSWSEGSIKMPLVISQDPTIAARINETLFLLQLEIPAPLGSEKHFNVPKGAAPLGTASLDFSIMRNDAYVLSLEFLADGCGAYCEEYKVPYNFDVRTGKMLLASELFTKHGFRVISIMMSNERKRQYTARINSIKQEMKMLRKKGKTKEAAELQDIIDFNVHCRGNERIEKVPTLNTTSNNAHAATAPETKSLHSFLILQDGIQFTTGRCSNHAMRAIDDVGDVVLFVSNTTLQPLLTTYSRSLLIEDDGTAAPPTVFLRILQGKIGGSAVTMLLDAPESDGSFSGTYFYNKYRKTISLSGKIKNKSISLTESSETSASIITLSPGATGYIGKWQGKNKSLPVILD